MKKILFLAPHNYELSSNIKKELERQGNDVTYIQDFALKYDPSLKSKNILIAILKKLLSYTVKSLKQYWKEEIDRGGLNDKYDIFFCINGYSFDKVLLEHLKSVNSSIRSVLYLWDSTNLYKFHKNFIFFDKIYSFDEVDAKKYNISYFPLFWEASGNYQELPINPKVFFVGSIHSDRFYILQRIEEQLKFKNIDYYIKLHVPRLNPPLFKLRYYFYCLLRVENFNKDKYEIIHNKKKCDFATFDSIPYSVFEKEMISCTCVIDIEQPMQSGITSRMIAALASNKKIITTNYNIKSSVFYDSDRILIIDRKNPALDDNFVNSIKSPKPLTCLQNLRLDHWLTIILK